jgi:hypothetical protein
MGNCQPVSRRRRSRRQSVEASATQSQPSSRSAQPTNSTSTGARHLHAHDDMPISQPARSATERSRAPSQGSTVTSNRLHSPPESPIDRTNAAARLYSANLAEPQNVGSAAQPANSTESSMRRETAGSADRSTFSLIHPAIAQPTHQVILERSGAQIGQPATHRTQAASPASLPRIEDTAPRGERTIQRTDATDMRTALTGESSQIASPSLNARRRSASGTEFPSVGTERAPAQATTNRGMAPTGEPMRREMSRPTQIRFHIQFPAASATSPEARQGETLDNFTERMVGERNAVVPAEHSRMIYTDLVAWNDFWYLIRNRRFGGPRMGFPPYRGK